VDLADTVASGGPKALQNRIDNAKEIYSPDGAGAFCPGPGLDSALREMDELSKLKTICISTGVPEINNVLGGGIQRLGLTVLSGQPGCGKTTLALQVSGRACRHGSPTIVLSGELSRAECVARMALQREGERCSDEWKDLAMGRNPDLIRRAFADVPRGMLSILDASDLVGRDICEVLLATSELQGAATGEPTALIVVDYLQLIGATMGTLETRRDDIWKVTKGLLTLTRMLKCATLVLSSVSRAVYNIFLSDGGVNWNAAMSSGKECGDVEFTASTLAVLARDKDGDTNLVVPKGRFTGTGCARLGFDGERGLFRGPDVYQGVER